MSQVARGKCLLVEHMETKKILPRDRTRDHHCFCYTFKMNVLSVASVFLVYSFIGWIIDTTKRSIDAKEFKTGSALPVPLCPVYAVGAFIVLGIHHYLPPTMPLVAEGFLYGCVLASLELATGIFFLKVFRRRLWVYKGGVVNIAHFTDLFHLLIWGCLGLFLVHILHPALLHVASRM
jgi:uncharacterized membrane protein